jgi:hypothetical protein
MDSTNLSMAVQNPPQKVRVGDRAIRTALKPRLLAEHAGKNTVLIEELGLCRGLVRADIAVVNGSLHGYEIKSDLDSLHRLQSQSNIYCKVLDYATLVVGSRLLEDALLLVPDWWGVLQAVPAECGLEFHTIRHAKQNPSRDPRALVELLWFEEAITLLERIGEARGVRGKPRRVLWDRICERVQVEVIAETVRTALKARPRASVVLSPSICDE